MLTVLLECSTDDCRSMHLHSSATRQRLPARALRRSFASVFPIHFVAGQIQEPGLKRRETAGTDLKPRFYRMQAAATKAFLYVS